MPIRAPGEGKTNPSPDRRPALEICKIFNKDRAVRPSATNIDQLVPADRVVFAARLVQMRDIGTSGVNSKFAGLLFVT
jgi:hypothetical protein